MNAFEFGATLEAETERVQKPARNRRAPRQGGTTWTSPFSPITIALTAWVGRTLSRAELVFLSELFHGDQKLAEAVNHLFVVGFCLVNLGLDALWLRFGAAVTDTRGLFEALSMKIGTVLLFIGCLHLADILLLSRYRRRALSEVGGRLALSEAPAPTAAR